MCEHTGGGHQTFAKWMCRRVVLSVAVTIEIVCASSLCVAAGVAPVLRPFTVQDAIGLAHFNYWTTESSPIDVSPNGHFVAIRAERGLLGRDRVEDELRVYDMSVLLRFVRNPRTSGRPAPVLDLKESTNREGPIISKVRWLANSSGLVFLLKGEQGNNELVTIGLHQARTITLSLKGQNVTEFAVRDASHYAYTVVSHGRSARPVWGSRRVAWDITGQPISAILFANAWKNAWRDRSILWAAVDGTIHVVMNQYQQPIVMYPQLNAPPVLSPDGHTLAAALPVDRVPESWMRQFRPPYAGDPNDRMRHSGGQNLEANSDYDIVTEYVLINLLTGAVTAVNGTPTGSATGWNVTGALAGSMDWSDDGKALLLPDAYLQPKVANESVARPCIAVFYPSSRRMHCVEPLKSMFTKQGGPEPGYVTIESLHFVGEGSGRILMRYADLLSGVKGTKEFIRRPGGTWDVVNDRPSRTGENRIDVYIRQDLDKPPVVSVVNADTHNMRVVWNPNPQLKNIALGEASVYHWTDATGRRWTGGLYKPSNYVTGRTYPLVIQTHGFYETQFRTSGMYPTAFAARALAASGMIVLQVPYCPYIQTPKSGPCDVAGIDAAVRQLAAQGQIDLSRVGIIGFSYTVYSVLYALTTSSLHFAAASITSGWNYGYWEYLTSVDSDEDMYSRIADATVGAKPFSAGLYLWLKRAPDFNMDRVRTPLLVNSLGFVSLIYGGMWEPYALLRYLQRPVDMVLLHSDEHVLTEPAMRLASQGGSVDWFRFWLQSYESPNPVLAGEYERWEKLCDMEKSQNPGSPTFCVPTRRDRNLQSANRTDAPSK